MATPGPVPLHGATGTKLSAKRPAPYVDSDNAFYWEGAARGELLLQQCSNCNALRHPPTPSCRVCRSLDWEAKPAAGDGTLYSYAVPRHPAFEPFGSGYIIALIELSEGLKVLTNLCDCAVEDVEFGMPVELFFQDGGNGYTLPQFRPQSRAGAASEKAS